MKPKFIFIYVTYPKKKLAGEIAVELLKRKLIACANMLPQMESIYTWQGRIHRDREVVLILKTRAAHFKKVERMIKAHHPYECPCIVALPLIAGIKGYFAWLKESTM